MEFVSLYHNVDRGLYTDPRQYIFLTNLYGDSFVIVDVGQSPKTQPEMPYDRNGEKKF
jgi:hypothetical protein